MAGGAGSKIWGWDIESEEWIKLKCLPDGTLITSAETNLDVGYATDGSATTLEDTAKNWGTDMWEGCLLEMTIDGILYSRWISSNTATVLTFDTIAPEAVVDGVPYTIKPGRNSEQRYTWSHGQKTVSAAGTAEQFSSLTIPSGYALVVSALPTNNGYIYLGSSKALAQTHSGATGAVILSCGQATLFYVYNATVLWIDADITGEGAFFFTEAL